MLGIVDIESSMQTGEKASHLSCKLGFNIRQSDFYRVNARIKMNIKALYVVLCLEYKAG